MLIYRASHPRGAVLGQLPGVEAYRDVERHPEAVTFPGLLIWRPGGDLFFASIGHVGEAVEAALASYRPPVRHILLDAGSVNMIDTTALRRAAERRQGVASPGSHVRLRARARRRARADAARGHRGCRRCGELPRTRDRWRARLAAAQRLSRDRHGHRLSGQVRGHDEPVGTASAVQHLNAAGDKRPAMSSDLAGTACRRGCWDRTEGTLCWSIRIFLKSDRQQFIGGYVKAGLPE